MTTLRPAMVTALLALAMFPPTTAAAQDSAEGVRGSVVKVYSIRRIYSLTTPWKRGQSSTVNGSGVVISPTQVLTNYHVVVASTDVSISLNGQSDRLSASVTATAPGIDLALITLDDPLPPSAKPLEIAPSTPKQGTKIQVHGYPKGGQSLSITAGVISRVEHVPYKFRTLGLRTQIDAALNSGNSGGPMIADGKVAGIAFSELAASNSIGYAIPCEEITVFLDDVQDGRYDGKPRLWCDLQTLESKEMRRWLKMPEDASGLKFAAMQIPVDDYPLKPNDVITHIGSFDVNNLGRVEFDENTQVSFAYAVEQESKLDGDRGLLPVKILRDGKVMEVEVPVFRDGHYLLRYNLDKPPTYFVYGPLVFGVATAEYLDSIDNFLAAGGNTTRAMLQLIRTMEQAENPYFLRRYDRVADLDQEMVVISKLISNRMTRDVKVALPAVIRTINGKPVHSVRAAAELVASLEDELIVIELEDNRRSTIVLNRRQIEREHDQIMEDNGIVNSASKDLRDAWSR